MSGAACGFLKFDGEEPLNESDVKMHMDVQAGEQVNNQVNN